MPNLDPGVPTPLLIGVIAPLLKEDLDVLWPGVPGDRGGDTRVDILGNVKVFISKPDFSFSNAPSQRQGNLSLATVNVTAMRCKYTIFE